MNVLLQSRTTLFSVPGGDSIQMLMTADALRKMGCAVAISTALEPDLSNYDIVHLFNLTRPQELYLQAMNAQRQHRKIVLSPIYVSYLEYERHARTGLPGLLARHLDSGNVEYLKIMARAAINKELNKGTLSLLLHGYCSLQNKIIDMADVLLPNSESEMKRACGDLERIRHKPYLVVPNAVDEQLFDVCAAGNGAAREYQGCVLCVARIDGVKNQLNLVRAMHGLPWPLVLIGQPAPNHQDYYAQVIKEAGPNVHCIGTVEHTKLPDFYKAARVHVLASWMETTGLSSLEAGAMGCNLVITAKGDTRDYFADHAFYCEPDSVESIRTAVIKAYNAGVDPRLRQRILDNFTWEKAAAMTLEGYRMALHPEGCS
jgi:glycosyltransferase involved in cell wall biosynthesis